MGEAVTIKSDQIYLELRAMLLNGEFRSGDRLVQRTLAQRLGVSPIPVLEALRRLERDGLVVSRPNAGAQVRHWTTDDVEGAYLAREALEGLAARLFVERASADERQALADLAQAVEDALDRGDVAASRAADLDFHLHLVRSTHSAALARLVENSCLVTMTILHSNLSPTAPPRAPDLGQHTALAAVLLGRDTILAEVAAREHIHVGLVLLQGAARPAALWLAAS